MALSYHAWWYPEIKDPALNFGMWEVNNNRLLEMGHVGPSGFGSDIKSTLVKIYKAETSPLDDLGVESFVESVESIESVGAERQVKSNG
jgi:hypothetical protein